MKKVESLFDKTFKKILITEQSEVPMTDLNSQTDGDEIEVNETSGNVAGTITATNGKVMNIEEGKSYTVFFKRDGAEEISQGNAIKEHGEKGCITNDWTNGAYFFFDNVEQNYYKDDYKKPEVLNIWTDEEFMDLLRNLK